MLSTWNLLILFLTVYIAYKFWDRFEPESIKGKRVVITGASTGIGEQIAYSYAKHGARILITARRENVLQQVTKKCMELGAEEAHYISLDMSNMNHTKKLIDEAEKLFHGLDHLVLNHMTVNYLALWEGDLDVLDRYYTVNVKAYVSLATHALPLLKKTNGSIAVMSSLAGIVSVPYSSAYCASKSALIGFFESLRHEFALQDINVSITICIIGSIQTENVLKFTEGILDPYLFMTSAEDTAERVMKGTSLREREVYYPYYQTWPTVVLRTLYPTSLDWIFKYIYPHAGKS
ncbi:hydroxysteroid 11-beta-dehydrogenase 1-like protein B [Ptychodera flava]|uniref:hydroxysteroid 11-beta-dehydrogenase 1-like protein B n=1 Tax=Ptychodera flava TaxID=63121 RepID=UPI003969D246